jgi:hypothetical protein
MRLTRTVDLGATGIVVVSELRVRDVRGLLERLQDPALQQIELTTLLRDRLPDVMALAGDSLQLPAGVALDDLALSECEAIGKAWWELHQRFFQPLLALGRAGTSGSSPFGISTGLPSSSSSGGTAGSGTTAGPST